MRINHTPRGPASSVQITEFLANRLFWANGYVNWYGCFGLNISSEKALNFLKSRRR